MSAVSNHEAPTVASSFETLASQAPQDEGIKLPDAVRLAQRNPPFQIRADDAYGGKSSLPATCFPYQVKNNHQCAGGPATAIVWGAAISIGFSDGVAIAPARVSTAEVIIPSALPCELLGPKSRSSSAITLVTATSAAIAIGISSGCWIFL